MDMNSYSALVAFMSSSIVASPILCMAQWYGGNASTVTVTGSVDDIKETLTFVYYNKTVAWLEAFSMCKLENQSLVTLDAEFGLLKKLLQDQNISIAEGLWTGFICPRNSSSWLHSDTCQKKDSWNLTEGVDPYHPTCTRAVMSDVAISYRVHTCKGAVKFACMAKKAPFSGYNNYIPRLDSSADVSAVNYTGGCQEECVKKRDCIGYTLRVPYAVDTPCQCLFASLQHKRLTYRLLRNLGTTHYAKNTACQLTVSEGAPILGDKTSFPCQARNGTTAVTTDVSVTSTFQMSIQDSHSTSTTDSSTSSSLAQISSVLSPTQTTMIGKAHTSPVAPSYSTLDQMASFVAPVPLSVASTHGSQMMMTPKTQISVTAWTTSVTPMFSFGSHGASSFTPCFPIISTSNMHASQTKFIQPSHSTTAFLSTQIYTTPANQLTQKLVVLANGTVANCSCGPMSLPSTSAPSLEDSIAKIQRDLNVERKNTMSYTRKFTSVGDKRTSSKVIGWSALVILSFLAGSVVVLDAQHIFSAFVIIAETTCSVLGGRTQITSE